MEKIVLISKERLCLQLIVAMVATVETMFLTLLPMFLLTGPSLFILSAIVLSIISFINSRNSAALIGFLFY